MVLLSCDAYDLQQRPAKIHLLQQWHLIWAIVNGNVIRLSLLTRKDSMPGAVNLVKHMELLRPRILEDLPPSVSWTSVIPNCILST